MFMPAQMQEGKRTGYIIYKIRTDSGDNDNDNGLAGVTAMAQSPTTYAVVAVESYASFRTNIIEIV